MGFGAFKTHDNDRGKCFRIIVVRGARPPHDNDSEEFFRIIVVRGPGPLMTMMAKNFSVSLSWGVAEPPKSPEIQSALKIDTF